MRRNRKAYITIAKEDIEYLSEILNQLLACLRAQSLSYQTSHWQVAGSHFYQEHLLLERLYNSVGEEIDILAEKISGLIGSDQVSLENQIPKMAMFLGSWAKIPDHLRRGLTSEEAVQDILKQAYEDIKDSGLMTLGLDDFLMATANAHEGNIYLLQQSINPRAKHISASRKRLRRRYADDDKTKEVFFADPRRVEVSEFATSNAVSNDLSTFENTLKEDRGHDSGLKVEMSEFDASPVTPSEVLKMPGAKELSTLNRFVVESEDPKLNSAIKMNQKREDIVVATRTFQRIRKLGGNMKMLQQEMENYIQELLFEDSIHIDKILKIVSKKFNVPSTFVSDVLEMMFDDGIIETDSSAYIYLID